MRFSLTCLLFCFISSAVLFADEPAQPVVIKLTLSPAKPSVPALKHKFVFTADQQRPGNAALMYQRAFLLHAQSDRANTEERADKLFKAADGEFDLKAAREIVVNNSVLSQVDIGALRERCDWQLPFREESNPIAILLPEAQSARAMMRLLSLRARVQLKENQVDEALATLRTGYTLARHVNEQDVLISSLVSVAATSIMNERCVEAMQHQDMPNLYWALTTLPRPPVDVRRGLRYEYAMFAWLIPELVDVDRRVMTKAEADARYHATIVRMRNFGNLTADLGGGQEDWAAWLVKAVGLLTVDAQYEFAKGRLLARGRTAAEVEKFPKSQALLIDMLDSFTIPRDEQFKYFALPYHQIRAGMKPAEEAILAAKKEMTIGGTLAALLLPALERTVETEGRLQRDVDALRVIEALRAHAAGHDGKWPAALDEIQDLPLAPNALTGKPFGYRLEGDAAILSVDGAGLPQQDRVYELRLRK